MVVPVRGFIERIHDANSLPWLTVDTVAGCLDHRGFLSWSGAVNAPWSGGASVIAQKPELSPAREDLAIRQESKRLPSSFCPSLADGYTAIGYASSNANTVNAPVTVRRRRS